MQEIDGVQVHVLSVPSKCCLPHSKVEVGRVDAVNLHIVVLVHPVKNGAELLDVPILKTVVEALLSRQRKVKIFWVNLYSLIFFFFRGLAAKAT